MHACVVCLCTCVRTCDTHMYIIRLCMCESTHVCMYVSVCIRGGDSMIRSLILFNFQTIYGTYEHYILVY